WSPRPWQWRNKYFVTDSQLSEQGLIKKVVALCSSDIFGPGHLVLGNSLSNSPDMMWRSMSNNHV
ncbi:Hypothetical predicted protein, partial [Olea europaea subsp. europaea]